MTTPGVVDAWAVLSARWGRLGLARALAPAIRIASGGFVVGERLDQACRDHARRLVHGGAEDWALRAAPVGTRFRQPELAALLEAVGRSGRAAFYEGQMAEAIVAAVGRTGGALHARDLATHRSEVVPPLSITWRGRTLHASRRRRRACCWPWRSPPRSALGC